MSDPQRVDLSRGDDAHGGLVALAARLPPLRTAVVWPMDGLSLRGAIEAAEANLIDPVLVGEPRALEALAHEADVDLGGYEILEAETSAAAAAAAVSLARQGHVAALLKGALHTDTLMEPVVDPERGLATERRVSHVFVMDVPSHPRTLFITDAAINIDPDLEEKRDIVQNAIDMTHALGIEQPRVALLSATEIVSSKLRSTIEAAALCKMAERGQIVGALLDGPLAFDTAVSEDAARTKHLDSPVAGRADVLVAPDLEAGNMLYKQLEYFGSARIAGVVLGARVPIALTSRADEVSARVASCALAAVLAERLAKWARAGPYPPG